MSAIFAMLRAMQFRYFLYKIKETYYQGKKKRKRGPDMTPRQSGYIQNGILDVRELHYIAK